MPSRTGIKGWVKPKINLGAKTTITKTKGGCSSCAKKRNALKKK